MPVAAVAVERQIPLAMAVRRELAVADKAVVRISLALLAPQTQVAELVVLHTPLAGSIRRKSHQRLAAQV